MSFSQTSITQALDLYAFENIWNEPADTYSVILQLFPVSQYFITNAVLGQPYIPMPAIGVQYSVFWTGYNSLFGSLIIANNTWTLTDQLANQTSVFFHVYTETGLMLPKGQTYLYYDPSSGKVFVAIKKAPYLKIVGATISDTMYLSVYRYDHAVQPITVTTFSIPSPDPGLTYTTQAVNTVIGALATTASGTFVYINGYSIVATASITINPGDYVDVYVDTTVIGSFTVDTTENTLGYASTLYGDYREVIHCPKAINPTNAIITTELLSITIRRKSDNVGLFLHRNAVNTLTQITHNDVALSTAVLNAYQTNIGSASVYVEVRVRKHTNTLIRDSHYIDYLYLCSDATIVQFLTGYGSPSLPFWTAISLEQSGYVGYMDNAPETVTTQTLTNYINDLGYYTVLAILCNHDRMFTVNTPGINSLSVKKPLIFYGVNAYPMVYLNGIKLRDTQVNYTNPCQDRMVLGITPDVYIPPGGTIDVELLEVGLSQPYLFTPEFNTPSIIVSFSSVSVYQINTLTAPVVGYQTQSTQSFTLIPIQSGGPIQVYASGTGVEVVFPSSMYGQEFMIQNATFSRVYGMDTSAQVASNSPINVTLTTLCTDQTTVVPLLGYQNLDVYMNGHRMIPGIDYAANPMVDANNNPALVQVIICNRQWLSLTGTNYVEVIAHTSTVYALDVGYAANNKLNNQNNIALWYSGLSAVFVGGVLQNGVTDDGNYLIPQTPVANGLPFMITAEVPTFVAQTLGTYTSAADDQKIAAINTYLNQQTTVNDTSVLIIPASWQLYSPYLTAIIQSAIISDSGNVTLYTNDPDNTLFTNQFSSFSYLLQNDPTLTTSTSSVNLRYCDVYPIYASVTVPNVTTYTILHRLATMLLPPDSNTLGEVLDD